MGSIGGGVRQAWCERAILSERVVIVRRKLISIFVFRISERHGNDHNDAGNSGNRDGGQISASAFWASDLRRRDQEIVKCGAVVTNASRVEIRWVYRNHGEVRTASKA